MVQEKKEDKEEKEEEEEDKEVKEEKEEEKEERGASGWPETCARLQQATKPTNSLCKIVPNGAR